MERSNDLQDRLPQPPNGFEWVSSPSGQAFDLRPAGSGVTLLTLHTGCHGDVPITWRVIVTGAWAQVVSFRGDLDEALDAVRVFIPARLREYRASLRSER